MNPDTKLVLEEITKLSKRFEDVESKLDSRLADQDAKWESRWLEGDDRWERRFADLSISHDARVASLESAAASFDAWRPSIEGSVDSIRLEMRKLSKHWERSVLDRATPILETAPSVARRSSAAGGTELPQGHRVDPEFREGGFGSVTAVVHSPANGTAISPDLHSLSMNTQFHRFSGHPAYGGDSEWSMGRLPKLNFPSFDGENPKLWLSRSVDFLEFSKVPPHLWVKLASMHIISPAARWLPSVESKLKSCSWEQFAQMVLDRFGRGQHELLVRQFLVNLGLWMSISSVFLP